MKVDYGGGHRRVAMDTYQPRDVYFPPHQPSGASSQAEK